MRAGCQATRMRQKTHFDACLQRGRIVIGGDDKNAKDDECYASAT
jgi:hypothetical protein